MKPLISAFFHLFFMGICFNAGAQSVAVSCPESAKYYAKDSINVITFGASTVEGINGTDFQTYLAQHFTNCYTDKVVKIEKYGVSGETTGQSLFRLNTAISGKTGFMVILVGVNDAVKIEAGKQTIAETEANMRQIIAAALNQKLVPLVCTLQFFDDRKDARLGRINNTIKQINDIYRKLTKEYEIYLADINKVFKRDFSLYQDDVHPNTKGNRLISYIIFDTINKIIAERFLQFTVSQNYPNPIANNYTFIDIVMPEPDKIELKIYSLQGKMVNSIINEYLNTGKHTIKLDLRQLPLGIYVYKVTSYSGLYTATKKMIIAR